MTDVVLRRGRAADVAFALAGLRVAQLWTPAENARSDSTRGTASDAPVGIETISGSGSCPMRTL